MTSNQKVLLAGFLKTEAQLREEGSIERDGLLTAAAVLVSEPSEQARLCPSQAAMEKAGWQPYKEGMVRKNADDQRNVGINDRQNSFRSSGGGHNAGQQDDV